jgi:predicted nucleotidyltransferase
MFDKVNITPLGITALTYLSRSPDEQFYVREIAALIGGSVGGSHKVLKNLHDMNLINKHKSGRNLYYTINQMNPSVKYFKIFMNIQELNEVIQKIVDRCKKIILYGSCSKGEDTMESDIDLFIITDDEKKIKEILKNTNIKGRQLKPIIMLPHEFIKLKSKDRAFYNEVNKGIVIWRDTNERL